MRSAAFAGPFRFPAAISARLAFALDQPVVETSRSNITLCAFLGARPYSAACFFVIFRRAPIGNV
ncbi:MAG: hypothetical protein LH624_13080 [Cryobacterium sp.]|nr:hypothetical protein [Cryobacterium sp.]